MVIKDWQKEHFSVISDFLKELNKATSDFVLKGGTSLMMCYNLDRFSEDIDLDGKRNNKSIEKIVDEFCRKNNYSYNVNKDTDTVKRFMIHYSESNKPLKVEISFRQKNIRSDNLTNINNIEVYNINSLCRMKASAYQSRDKIRDLYDVCFICNNYWNELSAETVDILRNAVEYKGIEQFDYILREQSDELIDNDKLTEDFLSMYDKLDLLYTEEEKDIMNNKLKAGSTACENHTHQSSQLQKPLIGNEDEEKFIKRVKEMAQWSDDVIERFNGRNEQDRDDFER